MRDLEKYCLVYALSMTDYMASYNILIWNRTCNLKKSSCWGSKKDFCIWYVMSCQKGYSRFYIVWQMLKIYRHNLWSSYFQYSITSIYSRIKKREISLCVPAQEADRCSSIKGFLTYYLPIIPRKLLCHD